MSFSTKECAFKHVTITLLGRSIIGLRGFEFKKSVEKEELYGAGDEPIDIQSGNKKYDGNLKLLKYEVDQLNEAAQAAGFADLLEVPHEAIVITCQFKKTAQSASKTHTARGVAFTEMPFGLEQNAKNTEVTLPFIAMKIITA